MTGAQSAPVTRQVNWSKPDTCHRHTFQALLRHFLVNVFRMCRPPMCGRQLQTVTETYLGLQLERDRELQHTTLIQKLGEHQPKIWGTAQTAGTKSKLKPVMSQMDTG